MSRGLRDALMYSQQIPRIWTRTFWNDNMTILLLYYLTFSVRGAWFAAVTHHDINVSHGTFPPHPLTQCQNTTHLSKGCLPVFWCETHSQLTCRLLQMKYPIRLTHNHRYLHPSGHNLWSFFHCSQTKSKNNSWRLSFLYSSSSNEHTPHGWSGFKLKKE